ncbi:MAG TPA: 4-hydroxythreonine-4-phosphate dehydrogenase PdxA [Kofleriaceae bacterium]|nr:4-hydroxythreonine-4-phosphate dehydrogenase PdxA [Kofleriaceae bacterium]
MTHTNRIGITLGDPSGIGPEIVAQALAGARPALRQRLVVFCDRALLERGAAVAGAPVPGDVTIVDRGELSPELAPAGAPTAMGGLAQVAYLEAATAAATAGEIAGVVTAPICKTTARAAHFEFVGHTDFLAARMGASRVAMMFVGPRLKVVLVTAHIPISEVSSSLTIDGVASAALMAVDALRRDFGVPRPRVGVLGLNPHAGEGGLFGSEDSDVIAPAIEQCRRQLGGDVELVGPLVPDVAFRQSYDLFVAMYHDQGLIPIKMLDFDSTVHLTLGLPIVRTSPDHGVAYDIAGKGVASPASFIAALAVCEQLVDRRLAESRA